MNLKPFTYLSDPIALWVIAAVALAVGMGIFGPHLEVPPIFGG